ncbi:inhibitor of growth protein 3 [Teleopsis dalmanni]|uniref:inhibitor of growth protein 3 n=1 Tax=Teleopsis dalmanni TaxID=139649 RepID=UPI0018CD7F7A|nr:inhibitor of growth protein 3 [Teleopsis dalmanni]
MLYLEDYLEMIEHLPQELRDRFTEIRELDLNVQNNIDTIEKKTSSFLQQCKRSEINEEEIENGTQKIHDDYIKVMEDADEKVSIATQAHELVLRYLRRLDTELFKFKCELEADHNGITEVLERRSLEMDSFSNTSAAMFNALQKENLYYNSPSLSAHNNHSVMGHSGGITLPATPNTTTKDNRYRTTKAEKRRDSNTLPTIPEKRTNLNTNIIPTAAPITVVRPVTPAAHTHNVINAGGVASPSPGPANVSYNLQQISNSGSNAIAVAASQAIVATQQMQQGRRTASLKASYEAINGATGPTEFWISRDMASAAPTATQNSPTPTTTEKKQKKKINTNQAFANAAGVNTAPPSTISLASSSSSSSSSVDLLPSVAVVAATATANSTNIPSLSLTSTTPSLANAAINNTNRASSVASSATATTPIVTDTNPVTDNGLSVDQIQDGDWTYDPNEPRYCTCNQVSYGDMVACDNEACPYEWFHYPCVGITQPPKGKWYCPKCTTSMRRRGGRKN